LGVSLSLAKSRVNPFAIIGEIEGK
jgi:hypothetical protein